MRVLIVHPHMSFYGGAELVIVNLANYLTKKGIENTVLTLSSSREIEKDLQGTQVIALKDKREEKKGISKFINFVYEILLLQRHLHKHEKEYDVINVHNFPAEYSLFPSIKNSVWMCNEPPIQLYLSTDLSFPLNTIAQAARKLDRVFVRNYVRYSCVSDEFNARRFEKIYGIKPEINNYGIDFEFFSGGESTNAKDKYNLQSDFVLLQVGTVAPYKNQMESIRVVEKVKETIPNIKLVLAGWGWSEQEYKTMVVEYVREKSLDNYVVFTGHISREEIRDLYQACDIAIFPVTSQGGWLSPFEALCAGKPVVVSSSITSGDIIKSNDIGIVTDDFPGAISDIYQDTAKYRAMGQKGKKWVQENINWENYSKKMLEIFEKISP